MTSIPDRWVVVKISSEHGTGYKVLGSWYGGYAYGNAWRMNSGITRVEKTDHSFLFYGNSGSCYECGFNNYGMHLESSGVVDQLRQMPNVIVDILPMETEWETIDYET
jgi:hypothetical protein